MERWNNVLHTSLVRLSAPFIWLRREGPKSIVTDPSSSFMEGLMALKRSWSPSPLLSHHNPNPPPFSGSHYFKERRKSAVPVPRRALPRPHVSVKMTFSLARDVKAISGESDGTDYDSTARTSGSCQTGLQQHTLGERGPGSLERSGQFAPARTWSCTVTLGLGSWDRG